MSKARGKKTALWIGLLCRATPEILGALRKATQDEDEVVRRHAMKALKDLGTNPSSNVSETSDRRAGP